MGFFLEVSAMSGFLTFLLIMLLVSQLISFAELTFMQKRLDYFIDEIDNLD